MMCVLAPHGASSSAMDLTRRAAASFSAAPFSSAPFSALTRAAGSAASPHITNVHTRITHTHTHTGTHAHTQGHTHLVEYAQHYGCARVGSRTQGDARSWTSVEMHRHTCDTCTYAHSHAFQRTHAHGHQGRRATPHGPPHRQVHICTSLPSLLLPMGRSLTCCFSGVVFCLLLYVSVSSSSSSSGPGDGMLLSIPTAKRPG
eukprot:GHVU01113466.1.p1 GENE.GHVU01113466.1~~GHVU01113466.1.p1  ORF type:complete len:202 (+),score=8.83 GHVU01113466.1:116-721(+)